MILAGRTFNLVHESRKQCASLNRGTILAWLLLTRTSSCSYTSVIAFQPNDFARWNCFVPPVLEENNAFTMFLGKQNLYNTQNKILTEYLVRRADQPKYLIRWIKRINYPRFYFKYVSLVLFHRISPKTTMTSLNGGSIGRSSVTYQ